MFCQVPGLLRANTGHVKGPEVDVLVIAAGLHGLRALGLRDQLQGRDPEAEQEALGQLEAGRGSLSLGRGVEDAQTDEVTAGARAEGIRTRGLAIKAATLRTGEWITESQERGGVNNVIIIIIIEKSSGGVKTQSRP